jgi:tetratricopeptide (TPR) repeat protein
MQLVDPSMKISPDEEEQILQTIEMFEVIAEANPHDCESLEILKDAYQRVGKTDASFAVARRLAQAFEDLNDLSSAAAEYQRLLKAQPNHPEILRALATIEKNLSSPHAGLPSKESPQGNLVAKVAIDLSFQNAVADTGTLMTTASTLQATNKSPHFPSVPNPENSLALGEDGNDALAKILSQHRFVTEEVVHSALDRVLKKNQELPPNTLASSLIDEISRRGAYETDYLLSGILDRCKFAYAPLEQYEIDRAIVRMLPEHLTIGRLIVPFDIMSRTVMIAMANPFDAAGKEAAQLLLDYNIQWHLAAPSAIFRILNETYRIEK